MKTPRQKYCATTRHGPDPKRRRIRGMSDKNQVQLKVFYNGKCPLCAAEISHYKHLAEKYRAALSFKEIHEPSGVAALAKIGLTPDQAARRLYGVEKETVITGVDAFIALWRRLPRFKALAALASIPGIRHCLYFVYNRFAAPALYKAHLKRQSRIASTVNKS